MLTGIPRRLNASLVVAIAVFVLSCGACAAKVASSYGATVSGGSAGPLDGFPAAGHSVLPFVLGGSANLSRSPEGSFGSFSGESPQALAVDQATGDVYAVDSTGGNLLRFTAAGAPADFSAGPGKGSNAIPGMSFQHFASFDGVAVDNSGGSSDGDVYVTQSSSSDVRVFSSSGKELATLTGSGTPAGSLGGEVCGVAVDQGNGDVYVASWNGHVWRYSPSGSPVVEGDYSGGIATSIHPCGLAVAKGVLYAKDWEEFPTLGGGALDEFETSAFATGSPPPSVSGTQLVGNATAVAADPASGDAYVDEGNKVSVVDSLGETLYSFAAKEVGSASAGVAVRAGGKAYVSDSSDNQIHAYGPTLEAGTRANLGSFGSFSGEYPEALAVDRGLGDVYAIDAASGKLWRFTAAGTPADFSAGAGKGTDAIPGLSYQGFPSFDQVAVDNSGGPSAGNVYVTQAGGQVKVFSSSGEELGTLKGSEDPSGGFGEECGLAVDQANGDLYIASYGNRIWRYTPKGSLVSEEDYSGGIETTGIHPCSLAVAKGTLYAKDWQENPPGAGGVDSYETSAFATGTPPPVAGTQVRGASSAVAADPATGDFYNDQSHSVTVINVKGEALYTFGSEEVGSSSTGVAIGPDGDAYVSDSTSHTIQIFGPFSAPPPIVETKPATNVKHVRATLNGHLDPNNSLPITGCSFEIGTDTSYSEPAIPCAQGNSYTEPADITAEATGLTPGTIYHYRLHLTTSVSSFNGHDESFETPPAFSTPETTTGKGTTLSDTSTRMEGTVDPDGNPISDCHFEYVTQGAFEASGFTDLSTGASVPCDQEPASIDPDFEDHPVTATATGLEPGQYYRYRLLATNTNGTTASTPALLPGPPIAETTGSPTRTTTTARLDSRVIPHGQNTTYWFEYTTDTDYKTNGFNNATQTPHTPLTSNEVQEVQVEGLTGQYKLQFGNESTQPLPHNAIPAEIRAALEALHRVGRGNVTVVPITDSGAEQYYVVTFVGSLANTDVPELAVVEATSGVNSFSVRTTENGGPRETVNFVSAALNSLTAGTIYDYRVVADNGTPGPPSTGEPVTLTTRDPEAPLTHGHFAGPPDSDRAWEQVSVPDTNGNKTDLLSLADSGERVVYDIDGGSPGSTYGGELLGKSNDQFAERTPTGWVGRELFPQRSQAQGNYWQGLWGATDLHALYGVNSDETHSTPVTIWRMKPGAAAENLYTAPTANFRIGAPGIDLASADGSRLLSILPGESDPAHPLPPEWKNLPSEYEDLYDLSSGTPQAVGLLPGNIMPPCGILATEEENGNTNLPVEEHRITPDGTHAFFLAATECGKPLSLYDRDLATETTTLIAPEGRFIRYTAGAVYFVSPDILEAGDPPGNDIYRYRVSDHSLRCLTCAFPGGGSVITDPNQPTDYRAVAVSNDGSRIYFRSQHRLLPGASEVGMYRLDVEGDALAYVAPATNGATTTADANRGDALSTDGSVFVFASPAPEMNATRGQQNGGARQYYRYDDRDRSLLCLSCPGDGSLPRGPVDGHLAPESYPGANGNPMSASGEDVAFDTPTPLVSADQNTAPEGKLPNEGGDIYEWREGRLLLVTDGRSLSTGGHTSPLIPRVEGMSPSGSDVFFTQSARLTPDTIDSSRHLYDARIRGGFGFPQPAPPCPLEGCQATLPQPNAPVTPGSSISVGPGNQPGAPSKPRKPALRHCPNGKVLKHGKCSKKPPPKRCPKGRARRHGKCVKVATKTRRANRNQRGVN
jgi:hypothetical protein